jgi:hypothetical protein
MATETAERPRAAASRASLSRRILVTIDQGMTIKTPKVIWEHELPIFQEVHGGGAEEGEGGAVSVVEDPEAFLDKDHKPRQRLDMLQHNKRQDDLTKPSEAAQLGFVFIGNPKEEWDRLAAAYGKCDDEDKLVVERIYGRARELRLAAMLGKPSLKDLPIPQLRQLIVGTGYVVDVAKDTPEAEKPAVLARRKEFLELDVAGLVKLADAEGVAI